MKIKTRGVVLQATPYSETSLVVKIYTEEYGLGSFIVSGVRTKNSRFKSNLFQPLSLVELVATGKPGGSLQRITEVRFAPHFNDIPGNLIKSTIAIFLAEVINRSIREEEPNPRLFEFLHSGIQILDVGPDNCSRFHTYFMIQLSRYTGFYPNGVYLGTSTCFDLREGSFTTSVPGHPDFLEPSVAELLWIFMNRTFENYHEVAVPNDTANELLQSLVTYYELHLTHGRPIQSHKILAEILR